MMEKEVHAPLIMAAMPEPIPYREIERSANGCSCPCFRANRAEVYINRCFIIIVRMLPAGLRYYAVFNAQPCVCLKHKMPATFLYQPPFYIPAIHFFMQVVMVFILRGIYTTNKCALYTRVVFCIVELARYIKIKLVLYMEVPAVFTFETKPIYKMAITQIFRKIIHAYPTNHLRRVMRIKAPFKANL